MLRMSVGGEFGSHLMPDVEMSFAERVVRWLRLSTFRVTGSAAAVEFEILSEAIFPAPGAGNGHTKPQKNERARIRLKSQCPK